MKTDLFEVSGGGEAEGAARQSYQLRGYGTTGDADTARERINAAAVCSPPGFVSRPVIRRGLRALGLIREDDSVTLLGLFDRAISHTVAVAAGEARVFSPQTPAVCLRLLDGLIELRLATGTIKVGPNTGEVQLSPGTAGYTGASVARNGDIVNPSVNMAAWMAAVKVALPAIPVPPATLGSITGSLSSTKA